MRRFVWSCAGALLALGCGPAPYAVEPQNPGDHCLVSCPEGLTCERPPPPKSGDRRRPGKCQLEPGRCGTSADCPAGGQCIRTSGRLGLCAP